MRLITPLVVTVSQPSVWLRSREWSGAAMTREAVGAAADHLERADPDRHG
jgi:hypothetical protein